MEVAGPLRAPALYRQATLDEDETSPRLSTNVTFDTDVISFTGSGEEKPGLFISGKNLRYVVFIV